MKNFLAPAALVLAILSGCKAPGSGPIQRVPPPVQVHDEYFATIVPAPKLEWENKAVLKH